jgi:acyl-coenzyme A thioesterase PaaI-like protein
MCNNFLQQMEIDALEQLISEDVKVQGQIVRDGSRTCLMDIKIVAGVVARVVTRVDEVYHHSFARVVAGGVRAHLNAH